MVETFVLIIAILLSLASLMLMVAFILEIAGWMWTGVPFVPTKAHAIEALPKSLSLTDSSVVFDLGCGDGRVLHALAQKSGAECIGYEKAPVPYLAAIVHSLLFPKKNVRIVYGDMYRAPLERATHVYLYLFPPLMQRLLPILKEKLRPGAVVVSCDFRFKTLEPSSIIPSGDGKNARTLYVYRF
jgi:SAM-dependent methyltransferase